LSYIAELRALIGTRPLIVVGASVVVLDDLGRVLLQRRTDDGTWGPIGGALEIGESLEDCARRELQEETGLRAESFEMIGVKSGAELYHRYPNGDEIYNVTVFFKALGVSGNAVADGLEGSALEFFNFSSLPKEINAIHLRLLEHLRSILTDAPQTVRSQSKS
jgi:8-oxo-dGTP pyrophosphatase MutT (NUDIX family)